LCKTANEKETQKVQKVVNHYGKCEKEKEKRERERERDKRWLNNDGCLVKVSRDAWKKLLF
jgi:hypothetical protein